MEKGMIQLYTGDGKGKTTAAAGLALRMLGNGMKVFFVQFMKSQPSGEIDMLARCGNEKITILREWDGSFVVGTPSDRQVAMCQNLWSKMAEMVISSKPDMVVLDEVIVAIACGLLAEELLLQFLHEKPASMEVVMTGRGASEKLIAASDLVTRMQKVKHYYDKGVKARRGIEF